MGDGRDENVNVMALDIGGANIKWATSGGRYGSHSFALWKSPDLLIDAVRRLNDEHVPDRWLVTMTGELCDCFETKRAGVDHLLQAVVAAAKPAAVGHDVCDVRVWSTCGGFVSVDDARRDSVSVAAANWHAQASVIARRFPNDRVLLIDMGSTTTDLIPMHNGQVDAIGLTDPGRLESGELVYVGARRTALMGVTDRVAWGGDGGGGNGGGNGGGMGGRVGGDVGGVGGRVMNERFATALDVQLLLGRVAEDENDTDTADNRPATGACAVTRMLRMIGADLDMMSVDDAVAMARSFDDAMRHRVLHESIMSTHEWDHIVISGSGECVLAAWLDDQWPGRAFDRLGEIIGPTATVSACAWALLQLDGQWQ